MTAATTHTPGPWRAVAPKGRDASYTSIVEGGDGRMVLFAGAPFRSDEEIVANARIAAVALDLLEALKALRGLVTEGGVPRYQVTTGAALNAVIEEVVDPAISRASTR